MESAEVGKVGEHETRLAMVALDRQTHTILKEEATKHGLSMAAVVRILVRKLRAGKVVII
jgi:hypothetical protein